MWALTPFAGRDPTVAPPGGGRCAGRLLASKELMGEIEIIFSGPAIRVAIIDSNRSDRDIR